MKEVRKAKAKELAGGDDEAVSHPSTHPRSTLNLYAMLQADFSGGEATPKPSPAAAAKPPPTVDDEATEKKKKKKKRKRKMGHEAAIEIEQEAAVTMGGAVGAQHNTRAKVHEPEEVADSAEAAVKLALQGKTKKAKKKRKAGEDEDDALPPKRSDTGVLEVEVATKEEAAVEPGLEAALGQGAGIGEGGASAW